MAFYNHYNPSIPCCSPNFHWYNNSHPNRFNQISPERKNNKCEIAPRFLRQAQNNYHVNPQEQYNTYMPCNCYFTHQEHCTLHHGFNSDMYRNGELNQRFNQLTQPNYQDYSYQSKRYVNSLKYEKTKPFAVDPIVIDEESPAVNLFNPDSGVVIRVQPGEQISINTHIIFKFPPNKFGFIADKASVITGKQLKVVLNVVYTGFNGEIVVVLQNLSKKAVDIFPGEAIAQMILMVSCAPLLTKEESSKYKSIKEMPNFRKFQESNKESKRNEFNKRKTFENKTSSLHRLF